MSSLFGGDGGASKEAERARADEAARQLKIRQGTSRINSIFYGGKTPTGGLPGNTVYDPSKTYYQADGSVWKPTGQYPANLEFPIAQGQPLWSGVKQSPGEFSDAFFKKRRQSYIDFAAPKLADQYGKAGQELTYALSRSGLLDSSARATQEGELTKLYDMNKQQVADQALSYETESRTAVEDAKQNLIQTLNATGDVQGATSSALNRASALSRPPSYSPLSQLFADFTNALGAQAAQERSFAAGGPTPRYNTGLFSPNKNSVVYG